MKLVLKLSIYLSMMLTVVMTSINVQAASYDNSLTNEVTVGITFTNEETKPEEIATDLLPTTGEKAFILGSGVGVVLLGVAGYAFYKNRKE